MSDSVVADEIAERAEGLRWAVLALAGVGAYLVGYGLTVLIAVVGPSDTQVGPGTLLNQMGFVFYSAHNVPLDVSGIGRMDWLGVAARPDTPEPSVPVLVFYAVPVVVLLAVGLVVAFRLVERTDDPVQVGVAVVAVAASYAVAMIAGTFVFTSQSVFGGPARLSLEDAVLFGLAYPVVFATFGAGAAGILAYLRSQASTSPA